MRKWIFLGTFLAIVTIGVVAFVIISQPPKDKLSEDFKKKAIANMLGRSAKLTDDTPKGNKKYDGKYISFEYPAKAVIYTYRGNTSDGTLEDFSFDIKDPKLVFNLKIKEEGTIAALSDIPSLRLREERSYEYTKSDLSLDGVKGASYFKDSDGGEMTGFFISNGKIITISVTGSNVDEVKNLFSGVVSSSQLKQ